MHPLSELPYTERNRRVNEMSASDWLAMMPELRAPDDYHLVTDIALSARSRLYAIQDMYDHNNPEDIPIEEIAEEDALLEVLRLCRTWVDENPARPWD
jgi:hypothetical protein